MSEVIAVYVVIYAYSSSDLAFTCEFNNKACCKLRCGGLMIEVCSLYGKVLCSYSSSSRV